MDLAFKQLMRVSTKKIGVEKAQIYIHDIPPFFNPGIIIPHGNDKDEQLRKVGVLLESMYDLIIFTDGSTLKDQSKCNGKTGASAVIYQKKVEGEPAGVLKSNLGTMSNNYVAELFGVQLGLKYIERCVDVGTVLFLIAESEDEHENPRKIVCETLAPLIPNYTEKDIDVVIDRAHRGGRRNNRSARGPRHIYVRFQFSSHVDEFMHAIKKARPSFKLERQFSKPVTERRNLAMLERKKLKSKNEIRSGYIDYPAKLMVKRDGETTYKLHQEY